MFDEMMEENEENKEIGSDQQEDTELQPTPTDDKSFSADEERSIFEERSILHSRLSPTGNNNLERSGDLPERFWPLELVMQGYIDYLRDLVENHGDEILNMEDYHKNHTFVPRRIDIIDFVETVGPDSVMNVIRYTLTDGKLEPAEAFALQAVFSPLVRIAVLQRFDEEAASGAIGEVGGDLLYNISHEHENLQNSAVLFEKIILAQFGINVSEGILMMRAFLDGTLEFFGGMDIDDSGKILERYGVDTHKLLAETPEALDELAAKGHKIGVLVNADAWSDDPSKVAAAADKGPNHIVQFVKVDPGDPEMVIVNDPGRADGDLRRIPRDTFMDAWRTARSNDLEAKSFNAILTTEPVPPLACEVPLSEMDQAQQRANLQPH